MVSSFAPESIIKGSARKKPRSDIASPSMVTIISDSFRHAFAAFLSPAPFRLATTAVVPTQMDWPRIRSIILGCAASPTEAIAERPTVPTIIVSAEFITLKSAPSRTLGQAIFQFFLYSSFTLVSSKNSISLMSKRRAKIRLNQLKNYPLPYIFIPII